MLFGPHIGPLGLAIVVAVSFAAARAEDQTLCDDLTRLLALSDEGFQSIRGAQDLEDSEEYFSSWLLTNARACKINSATNAFRCTWRFAEEADEGRLAYEAFLGSVEHCFATEISSQEVLAKTYKEELSRGPFEYREFYFRQTQPTKRIKVSWTQFNISAGGTVRRSEILGLEVSSN